MRADRLVNHSILVKAAGTAIHMLTKSPVLTIKSSVQQLCSITLDHYKIKIRFVRRGFKGVTCSRHADDRVQVVFANDVFTPAGYIYIFTPVYKKSNRRNVGIG